MSAHTHVACIKRNCSGHRTWSNARAYPAAVPAELSDTASTDPGPLKLVKFPGVGATVRPARAANPVQTTSNNRASLKIPSPLLSQMPSRGRKAWMMHTAASLVSLLLCPYVV